MKLPKEVQTAKDAYFEEYNKIAPLVKANKKKYIGTKFEDCPPLIKEQGRFFVKRLAIEEAKAELKEKYGNVPHSWAHWVAWYRGRINEKNSV